MEFEVEAFKLSNFIQPWFHFRMKQKPFLHADLFGFCRAHLIVERPCAFIPVEHVPVDALHSFVVCLLNPMGLRKFRCPTFTYLHDLDEKLLSETLFPELLSDVEVLQVDVLKCLTVAPPSNKGLGVSFKSSFLSLSQGVSESNK